MQWMQRDNLARWATTAMLLAASVCWTSAKAADGGDAKAAGATPSLIARASLTAGGGDGDVGWAAPWRRSAIAPGELTADGAVIRGTDDRNNPLRRALAKPFAGDELFVAFTLDYDASSVDQAGSGPGAEGEFFVLWLDEEDGGHTATHISGTPNIGVHVGDRGAGQGKNLFMARFSPNETTFTEVELRGGQATRVVARLSRRQANAGFGAVPSQAATALDRLELWVNPTKADRSKPDATAVSRNSLKTVRWVGFSTGRKTEPGDRITVRDLVISGSWSDVAGGAASPSAIAAAPADRDPGYAARVPRDKLPQMVGARVDFAKDVAPILKQHCLSCHTELDAKGVYRLNVREEILGVTTGHPLAKPGDAAGSLLYQKISATSLDQRMPPKGPGLSAKQIATLGAWIDQGLAWDEQAMPAPALATDHWAFQPVQRPTAPQVSREGWVRTPIDAFIAKAQQAANVTPAPRASRRTLIRRLSLDLLGLPPTPAEVEAFVNDPSDRAYETLVERLLSSRRYGERWGRHWLDLARYAQTNGHQHNSTRDHAWRYRDYVINSFNQDKPYDQFVREQIAGDEMQPYSDEQLIATGFLAAAQISGNEMDKDIQRHDVLVDVVNATSSTFLGLTMACAQCHNHKFDPITARDYYRFLGFFVKGQPGDLYLKSAATLAPGDTPTDELVQARMDLYQQVYDRLYAQKRQRQPKGEIVIIRKHVVNAMTADEKARYNALGKQLASRPQTWGYYSPATSPTRVAVAPMEIRWPLPYEPDQLARAKPYLLVRGDVSARGPEVDVGWPRVFGPVTDQARLNRRPRTALADWMTSDRNPLTARVWVNRIWQHHFGRGLAPHPSNLGVDAPPPKHRELLDWLAAELMASNWSTKHIHRLILWSSTYQTANDFTTANHDADPGNETYWRWVPRRLEAEAIRDAMLHATGDLDLTMGGPGDKPDRSDRRSIYLFVDRNNPARIHRLFDGPTTTTSCAIRDVSTVALQPLYLLNNPLMQRQAQRLAERVRREAGEDVDQQIERAFHLTLSRPPDEDERQRVLAYFQDEPDDALKRFCHALLNLSEFVYIP